jgi:raffinose/stachyose/melibiose transport system permease protein
MAETDDYFVIDRDEENFMGETKFLNQKTKMNIITALFILPAIVIFVLVFAWPFFLTIYSSFTNWDGISPMKFIGINNYAKLFQDREFDSALKNTSKSMLWAIFAHVPFATLVALALSHKLRGWKFVRSTFMLPSMISSSVFAMLFMYVYRLDCGLVNSIGVLLFGEKANINYINDTRFTYTALTMMWVWFAGTLTLILLSELMSVQTELYDAARVDGANDFQIDWYINIPLIRRIIGTAFVLAITGTFKQFDLIYLSTSGGPAGSTLNFAILMYKNMTYFKYGRANAIGVMLMAAGVITMMVIMFIFRTDNEDKSSRFRFACKKGAR